MESIRAFIAVELDDDTRRALGAVQARLKRAAGPAVRWVRPEGVHLTLKFLGDIDPAKTDAIAEAMTRAAQGSRPFSIGLGEIGGFPSLERARVIWIGLTGEVEALVALQGALERLLEPLGLPPEGRAFTPHLTLGRVRPGGPAPALAPPCRGEAQRARPAIAAQRVESISLIQSTLRPDGALYQRLRAVRLGNGLP